MTVIRAAEHGKATVYVEHGVWLDAKTGRIHVTVPGQPQAHWSLKEHDALRPYNDRMYAVYRSILQEQGRW